MSKRRSSVSEQEKILAWENRALETQADICLEALGSVPRTVDEIRDEINSDGHDFSDAHVLAGLKRLQENGDADPSAFRSVASLMSPKPLRPFRTDELVVRESGRVVKRISLLDSPSFDLLESVPRPRPDHSDVLKIGELLRRTA